VTDRLGPGILSGPVDGPWRTGRTYPEVEATTGLVVTHLGSRFKGAVVRFEQGAVVLRSANTGSERIFTLYPGSFALGAETVTLVRPPVHPTPAGAARTASGSLAVGVMAARVAQPSRLLVEGLHDAELVEKVWGDDLRIEGVVVERLDGIDSLAEALAAKQPSSDARIGVLVDHLVPGSKESRLAAQLAGPHVRICGTPFIDIWQAIRPSAVGIASWPTIPPGRDWKTGVCQALGEPSPGRLWRQLLARVRTYADLEPALVGAVEALIDFVTTGE
jgi:hypothetical protein